MLITPPVRLTVKALPKILRGAPDAPDAAVFITFTVVELVPAFHRNAVEPDPNPDGDCSPKFAMGAPICK